MSINRNIAIGDIAKQMSIIRIVLNNFAFSL